MIDRDARNLLAVHLRRLASGRLTNDEFEDERPVRSSDSGVLAVSWGAWQLYSDLRNCRFVGADALTPEVRRHVAQRILFLQTNLEYEWPAYPRLRWWRLPFAILTFGRVSGRDPAALKRWEQSGEFSLWPFFRRIDWQRAIGTPRFLVGDRAQAS